jgi:hypothetical protein
MPDMTLSDGVAVLRELAQLHNKPSIEVSIQSRLRSLATGSKETVLDYRGGIYCDTVEDSVISFQQPTVRGVVESVREQILSTNQTGDAT